METGLSKMQVNLLQATAETLLEEMATNQSLSYLQGIACVHALNDRGVRVFITLKHSHEK